MDNYPVNLSKDNKSDSVTELTESQTPKADDIPVPSASDIPMPEVPKITEAETVTSSPAASDNTVFQQPYAQQPYAQQQTYAQQTYAQQPYAQPQTYAQQPYAQQQTYAQQPYVQPQTYAQPQPYTQQNYYQYTPVNPAVVNSQASDGFAIASLICGIAGLLTCCTFIPSLLSVIFGIISKVRNDGTRPTGVSTAGLTTGILGMVFGILYWVYVVIIAVNS